MQLRGEILEHDVQTFVPQRQPRARGDEVHLHDVRPWHRASDSATGGGWCRARWISSSSLISGLQRDVTLASQRRRILGCRRRSQRAHAASCWRWCPTMSSAVLYGDALGSTGSGHGGEPGERTVRSRVAPAPPRGRGCAGWGNAAARRAGGLGRPLGDQVFDDDGLVRRATRRRALARACVAPFVVESFKWPRRTSRTPGSGR
jgi:hypothetical protein